MQQAGFFSALSLGEREGVRVDTVRQGGGRSGGSATLSYSSP
jgi:hypothetical protein